MKGSFCVTSILAKLFQSLWYLETVSKSDFQRSLLGIILIRKTQLKKKLSPTDNNIFS